MNLQNTNGELQRAISIALLWYDYALLLLLTYAKHEPTDSCDIVDFPGLSRDDIRDNKDARGVA